MMSRRKSQLLLKKGKESAICFAFCVFYATIMRKPFASGKDVPRAQQTEELEKRKNM